MCAVCPPPPPTENRTTTWEDPRMLNPSIAGEVVPYSRDYKQKYEYLRNQLKRPVSPGRGHRDEGPVEERRSVLCDGGGAVRVVDDVRV